MKKIALVLMGTFSLMYANTLIKSVDIYNNKTILNQQLDLNKNSADLIGNISLENIKFNIDNSCKIVDLNFNFIDSSKNEIDNMILDLEKQISKVKNKKRSLETNISFLENLKLQRVENIDLLKQSSDFLKHEILNNSNKIYDLELELDELNKQITQVKRESSNNKFTKLDYSIDCKGDKNSVVISYPTYLLNLNKVVDINFNTKNKKIEFKENAYITQSTGVDFNNININFYTGNYYDLVKPNRFTPKYLDIDLPKPVPLNDNLRMESQIMMKTNFAKAPKNDYIELATKSLYKVSNVSLKTSKKTKILIVDDNYKSNSFVEIDGYSSANGFYKVDFKSDKLYNRSYAKLFIDEIYVGKTNIEEIKKDKKSSIYFGKNSFINVKKELIKDLKEEPFFSLNTTKTQKVWEYNITNSGNNVEKISLVERVPVSKHEDIKIKLIGKTKYTKLDKNGKIYYDFELKPKDSIQVEFGYEIEKPIKKDRK